MAERLKRDIYNMITLNTARTSYFMETEEDCKGGAFQEMT
jgi:hypothetical protein